jgi:hypothetical protein
MRRRTGVLRLLMSLLGIYRISDQRFSSQHQPVNGSLHALSPDDLCCTAAVSRRPNVATWRVTEAAA